MKGISKHYTGLSSAEVRESRSRYGENILTPPPRPSLWRKFLSYFRDPLIKILLVALLLSVGISFYEYFGGVKDGAVFLEPLGIFFAVVLATMIGFWLEVNADRKFEILNKVNDDLLVKVVRNGGVTQIPRREVVVGDCIIIETGDEIVADGKILESVGLRVNESSLTGEPQVSKSHLPEDNDPDATYPTDMALKGTTVVEGSGVMSVTAVGDATEYGKVYEAAQIDTGVKTPLSLQLERLGKLISSVSYIIGALIVIGRSVIFNWADATSIEAIDYALTTVMLAITLLVVSVPEGLPMSVTLSLALSMRRMLASNNLVRKLHACETMGATTVICTDKTGTLTMNRMRVATTDFAGLGESQKLGDDSRAALIAESIATNSSAFLQYDDNGTPSPVGNPTEGALLLWLYDNGVDYLKIRETVAVVGQLSFSTQRKYMTTVVDSPVTGRRMVYVKGAPEIILAACRTVEQPLTREGILATLSDYQSRAMRTLGFAFACVPDEMTEPIVDDGINPELELTFIGVCAISDPIREEVPAAIANTRSAGIDVKVVTGDTPGTACEIARQIGLWTDSDGDAERISGPEWAALTDEEAAHRAQKIKIMSRARPTDKSRLVSILQKQGAVVAVTGDGTNDAPALNTAQVGLSMGDGTAVAKEASDITIMDNSFASITKAVMWGRSLYQNIQRFILFQLTVNLVACVIVVIGAFTGTESPLTVAQMLWVNLIMDTFAALALASLPPSAEVMKQKPRRSDDFIITRGMYARIVGFGLLFTVVLYGMLQYLRLNPIDSLSDFSLCGYVRAIAMKPGGNALTTYDLTMFFTLFVFLQFWNLFNARSFGSSHSALFDMPHSKVFFMTVAVIFIGQIAIVYLGGTMFNVCPISISDMLIIIAISSPVMLVPTICAALRGLLKR